MNEVDEYTLLHVVRVELWQVGFDFQKHFILKINTRFNGQTRLFRHLLNRFLLFDPSGRRAGLFCCWLLAAANYPSAPSSLAEPLGSCVIFARQCFITGLDCAWRASATVFSSRVPPGASRSYLVELLLCTSGKSSIPDEIFPHTDFASESLKSHGKHLGIFKLFLRLKNLLYCWVAAL